METYPGSARLLDYPRKARVIGMQMCEEYFVDIGERYLVVLEGSSEGLLPRLFSRIDEHRLILSAVSS